ncbi:hypothetical protein E2P81_ATG01754 [Venturia nashicola]|nr:hypothetical protein E2P81_ATG01754 [Venturia nashicola]
MSAGGRGDERDLFEADELDMDSDEKSSVRAPPSQMRGRRYDGRPSFSDSNLDWHSFVPVLCGIWDSADDGPSRGLRGQSADKSESAPVFGV